MLLTKYSYKSSIFNSFYLESLILFSMIFKVYTYMNPEELDVYVNSLFSIKQAPLVINVDLLSTVS